MPAKTRPVFTPTRTGSAPGRSTIARVTRSISSSSSPPAVRGAPASRIALTAPLLTSVWANVTSKARQLSWIAVMRSSSAAASAVRALALEQLVRSRAARRTRSRRAGARGRPARRAARACTRPGAAPRGRRRTGSKNGGTVSGTPGPCASSTASPRASRRAGSGSKQRAVAALSAISPAPRDRLGLDAGGHVGAGDDQLAVDPADEEEVELAGVDADRHLQPHGPGRGGAPAHAARARPASPRLRRPRAARDPRRGRAAGWRRRRT